MSRMFTTEQGAASLYDRSVAAVTIAVAVLVAGVTVSVETTRAGQKITTVQPEDKIPTGVEPDGEPNVPRPLPPPKIPGLEVKVGDTVVISSNAGRYGAPFRFRDGRLNSGELWSHDGGRSWKKGPNGPGVAMVRLCPFEYDDGKIISPDTTVGRHSDGKLSLWTGRSLDNWKTVTNEGASVDIPLSVPQTTDEGDEVPGVFADHGVLRLKNGSLMMTAYGRYKGDESVVEDFRSQFKKKFYRTRCIALFSSDNGKAWKDPVTIAYDPKPDPKRNQTGFSEGDLARAPNGDILCVMRTGGSKAKWTPMYLARSGDEGRTWSKPVPIADRGVWPSLCVLKSGVIVCVYGRPDEWLIFSTDSGQTWKGAYRFLRWSTSGCHRVFEIAPDTILVTYEANRGKNGLYWPRTRVMGTFFTVKKNK